MDKFNTPLSIATTTSSPLKGNLGSPTTSFLHSKAPEKSDGVKFADLEGNRHYVRLQMVDLAGSEKETQPMTKVKW